MLDRETFIDVVKHTPLVSIDLVVMDNNERVLLGHRRNEPARGFWFVPGGRILKDETLATALYRISRNELGIEYSIENAEFLGCYEHLYNNNFASVPGISTHYVVLAYNITLAPETDLQGDQQHDCLRWFTREDILKNPDIHENTRAYFRE